MAACASSGTACNRAVAAVSLKAMDDKGKELLVVGDRVLIAPEEGEERSRVGLYLPPSAVESQAVQGGTVVATGPGTPISPPTELDSEPWKISAGEAKYMPVQARVGDYAIFFRRAAVEITFEDRKYLVVPLAALLVLVRENSARKREREW
jgi:chaperonin GroES